MCDRCQRWVRAGLGCHPLRGIHGFFLTPQGEAVLRRAQPETPEAAEEILDVVSQQLEDGTLRFSDLPVYVGPETFLRLGAWRG